MQKQKVDDVLRNPHTVVTPRFLLRVGGLPITRLEELRFPQTVQWQESLLAIEHVLFRQRDRLVDILHEAVNRYKEAQDIRRNLINLKRQIFNMNMPRGTKEARAHALSLEPEEQQLLFEWLDLWERYQKQLTLGTDILTAELQEKRQLLKRILADTDFRKGILLSSTILDQAATGYLASKAPQLNREARTVERSLLEYLFRTASKTSPFSTFTPVCVGTFEEGEQDRFECDDDILLSVSNIEKKSFTRLNMLVLSRISAQILASPAIRYALRVRITNGWRLRANRIEYIRRKPVSDTSDSETALPLDYIQEHVIQLPISPVLRQLIALLGDGHEEQLATVIAQLCENEQQSQERELVEEYLQHLLRLGFLIVPVLQINIHHDRPLSNYLQRVRTISTPETDALADALAGIEHLVDTYASADIEERREILLQVRKQLQEGSMVLNTSQHAPSFPKTLVYEDTTLTPDQLAISSKQWTDILAHLQQLQQVMPVFDSRLPQKIMTRGYFQARYGVGQRCDDFFSFADMFNQEFLRLVQSHADTRQWFDSKGKFKGHQNYFNQPELKQLNEARHAIIQYMRSARQGQATGSEELILGEDFFQSIAPLVSGLEDFNSSTFMSQFARVDGEPLFIINQIYSGLTLLFSRFAYCFNEDQRIAIVSTLRQTLQRIQPPDAVFAELKGGYDATNLNLHPIFTRYEIVCPGELSSRPEEEQITLEDLAIQDDEKAGRLRLYSKRLGKEVIPLYLGFLTPRALPEMQNILLNFSYLTLASLDLWSGTQLSDPNAPVNYYPRLRYKNVVIQRATWKVQGSTLPQRDGVQSDTDFFLAVNRWRKSIGLPARVFITPIAAEKKANPKEKKGARAEAAHSYKPLYVDFENFFSVLLLEATIRKSNSDYSFTEMLPLPEHLWFQHEDQTYVSEFILEVTQTRRDDHATRLD